MQQEDQNQNRREYPVQPFEQEKEAGNLSPLRSSSKWDAVHNEAVKGYAMRADQS